ncbi:MAG: hypothetical protein Kow001_06020 [Acidobacteriota bacterium]
MTAEQPDYTAHQSSPGGTRSAPPPPAYPRTYYEDSRVRSPLIAGFLSILPGLGQIYVGYYQQGFINILVTGSLISFIASGTLEGLIPLAGFFLVFFWLYNIVDAARRAAFYNQALAGLDPTELPRDVALPAGQGSLAAGVTLVVVGGIALSHTLFNIPLDWVEDWWPVALVAMGGWLVYRAVQNQRAR